MAHDPQHQFRTQPSTQPVPNSIGDAVSNFGNDLGGVGNLLASLFSGGGNSPVGQPGVSSDLTSPVEAAPTAIQPPVVNNNPIPGQPGLDNAPSLAQQFSSGLGVPVNPASAPIPSNDILPLTTAPQVPPSNGSLDNETVETVPDPEVGIGETVLPQGGGAGPVVVPNDPRANANPNLQTLLDLIGVPNPSDFTGAGSPVAPPAPTTSGISPNELLRAIIGQPAQ